jgi:methylated-DNA-[protein]-cysteine S-methyltransferase
MRLWLERWTSPIGTILLVSDGEALRALDFSDYEARTHQLLRIHYGAYDLREGAAPRPIGDAIRAYFAGELRIIDKIPTATGGSEFQRRVWAGLREIPAGTTLGYGKLAERVGKPKASRAVGLANGANPIAIVVPCHRVIGANGTLTGYGGGLERKRWLLEHERVVLKPESQRRQAA